MKISFRRGQVLKFLIVTATLGAEAIAGAAEAPPARSWDEVEAVLTQAPKPDAKEESARDRDCRGGRSSQILLRVGEQGLELRGWGMA